MNERCTIHKMISKMVFLWHCLRNIPQSRERPLCQLTRNRLRQCTFATRLYSNYSSIVPQQTHHEVSATCPEKTHQNTFLAWHNCYWSYIFCSNLNVAQITERAPDQLCLMLLSSHQNIMHNTRHEHRQKTVKISPRFPGFFASQMMMTFPTWYIFLSDSQNNPCECN